MLWDMGSRHVCTDIDIGDNLSTEELRQVVLTSICRYSIHLEKSGIIPLIEWSYLF